MNQQVAFNKIDGIDISLQSHTDDKSLSLTMTFRCSLVFCANISKEKYPQQNEIRTIDRAVNQWSAFTAFI